MCTTCVCNPVHATRSAWPVVPTYALRDGPHFLCLYNGYTYQHRKVRAAGCRTLHSIFYQGLNGTRSLSFCLQEASRRGEDRRPPPQRSHQRVADGTHTLMQTYNNVYGVILTRPRSHESVADGTHTSVQTCNVDGVRVTTRSGRGGYGYAKGKR